MLRKDDGGQGNRGSRRCRRVKRQVGDAIAAAAAMAVASHKASHFTEIPRPALDRAAGRECEEPPAIDMERQVVVGQEAAARVYEPLSERRLAAPALAQNQKGAPPAEHGGAMKDGAHAVNTAERLGRLAYDQVARDVP